ncbi:uncharacterized protein LOC100903252 [Galendromus occidentalis]|uniref:Uncharacterized protein LOC100903252 n=1 Tax=Galendromus occidentalis TaxID=34638 RepID=A0AAJ7PB36_9ACAR|nr:uncharacterized protein LOC100903252 [Galendromus occidentalis]
MNKQKAVSLVFVVVVVSGGGQAAELPERLREGSVSADMYEASPAIVSAAGAAAVKNTIVSGPSSNSPSVKSPNTVIVDSAAVTSAIVGAAESAPVVRVGVAVDNPAIAVAGNPNETVVVYSPEANNGERRAIQNSLKLIGKPASMQSTKETRPDGNEHDVNPRRDEKVTPIKENTVATHAIKGGGSSSLKVAAQMVGVYQHNKR